jgi:hypothetical protein
MSEQMFSLELFEEKVKVEKEWEKTASTHRQ